MLHFAPEPGLAQRFAHMPRLQYLTADISHPGVSLRCDITSIPLAARSVDLLLCCHVLEHVPNDQQAMRELHRILKPAGTAIILVPLHGEQTYEDPSITDPIQRERFFGQFDHVRKYGRDIVLRLNRAGFAVTSIDARDLATDPADIERMGLPVGETIFVCRVSGS